MRFKKALALLLSGVLLFPSSTPTAIAQTGSVEAMECPEVEIIDSARVPMDPFLAQSIVDAHRIATGSGVTIAVIDTGISPHFRLPPLIPGGDFVGAHWAENTPGEFIDCDGHGTIVAGVIAAQPNAGSGWLYDGSADAHIGVAPQASLISIKQTSGYVRTSEDSDVGTLATLAQSIHRAIELGAHIINISVVSCLSTMSAHSAAGANLLMPLDDALAHAEMMGVVVVAAAGNLGQDCPEGSTVYPAHSDTVLAVSARHDSHTIAHYSVPGQQKIVSALGKVEAGLSPRGDGFVSAMTTQTGRSPFEGTSFAAPVVSATAALIRERYPHVPPSEVRERILSSIDPARGAIDPYSALTFELYDPHPPLQEVRLSAPTPKDNSTSRRASAVLLVLVVIFTLLGAVLGLRRHSAFSTKLAAQPHPGEKFIGPGQGSSTPHSPKA